MAQIEIKVPDIGDFKDVPVIELLVKPGDTIGKEDALVTLESDKATMEVPSTHAGIVKEVRVKVGDKVSQGTLIAVLDSADAKPASAVGTARPTADAGPARDKGTRGQAAAGDQADASQDTAAPESALAPSRPQQGAATPNPPPPPP